MSPEMLKLANAPDKKGRIDLYYNDYWGVHVTMDEAHKIYNSPRVEKSKDPTIISEGSLEFDKRNELAQSMLSNLEEQCSDKAPIVSQCASKNS